MPLREPNSNSPLQVPVSIRHLTLLSAFTLRYDEIKASLQVKTPAAEVTGGVACRTGTRGASDRV